MSKFVNIKNARKALNLTQKEMGDKCGVGLRTIQNWESGTTKPTEAVMRMIESWLTPDDYEKIAQYERANNEAYFTYLLPMSAAGGTLSGFPSEGTRLSDCEKVVSPIADVDFAMTVYGDSMYPDYPSGSRILIKKIDPSAYIAWGNVFVLDTVNGVILKEVQPSDHEGKLVCHSHNPNGRFKDFEMSMDDIYGMYRVLACVTMK